MGRQITYLDRRRAAKESVVGGKAAGLSRLMRSGFNVPSGFAINTVAFQQAYAEVRKQISFLGTIAEADRLKEVRHAFLSLDFPPALKKDILAAYADWGGPVAVRSSFVGEDSLHASFAGQLDSFLNVTGREEVLDAVRRCMASAFNDRLWKYIETKNTVSKHRIAMAVIVQRMIEPEISGAMFSRDVSTSGSVVIIEAVRGIGENLAQGLTRPDHYRIDRSGALVESSPAVQGAPLLHKETLNRLARLAADIEAKFKFPQDIEWAMVKDELYILQSRPISSARKKRVYSNRLVSDMAPGLVKPLVWSTKYMSMNKNVFVPLFTALLGPVSIDPEKFTKRIHSRLYADMTTFGDLLSKAGFPPNFFEMIARNDRISKNTWRFHARMAPVFFRILRFVFGPFRIHRKVEPFLRAKEAELEEFRSLEWEKKSAETLLRIFHRLNRIHGVTQWQIFIVTLNMAVRSKLLNILIKNCRTEIRSVEALSGYLSRENYSPLNHLKKMAFHANELDSRILDRILTDRDINIQAVLSQSAEGRALQKDFDEFIRRFAFLSANGSDFSEVPWIEAPLQIWKAVAGLARERYSHSPEEIILQHEKALRNIRLCMSSFQRCVFDRLHRSTIKFIEWRERVSSVMTEETYLMRRCLLALAGKWVQENKIANEDDIFFIYADELKATLSEPSPKYELLKKIEKRRARIEKDEAIDPPDFICGDETFVPIPASAPSNMQLNGISGSTGICSGKARIVHKPLHLKKNLSKEDILVVPFTDLGWTPFLAGIGGIVAETGGQLSHTSIIAREYGIPAVVSVPNATSLIREGQTITVDGTGGLVYLSPVKED